MSNVFVIDTNKQPQSPVHPGRARLLLKAGKAAVWRRYPFTIILKTAIKQPSFEPLRLKIDPGSQITGMALVQDATGEVVWPLNSPIGAGASKSDWIGGGHSDEAGDSAKRAIESRDSRIGTPVKARCPLRWKAASAISLPGLLA